MGAKGGLTAWLVVVALVAASVEMCAGRQHYRSRIPNGANVPCPPDHDYCEGELCVGVGHMSCLGGVVEPERNPFGKDFEAEGLKWTNALCNKDSDEDGFTNGEELGDPCCVWHEGARLPLWMRDWDVTHPGFASSVQDQPINHTKVCKDVKFLESDSFYNPGEKKMSVEYFIDDHVLPAKETIYEDIRFNFPDDNTYDVVGIEPIIDNTELIHHFVMTSCDEKTKDPGALVDSRGMDVSCEETMYLWAPGSYNFTPPKNAGVRVGKGTRKPGFNLEVHYDNPELRKGQRDASGVRIHFTPTLREVEMGVLWVGTILSVGRIPPGEKEVYSSTIIQVKVDEKVAPEGVKVFGFSPHMHLLGRRLWTDHFRMPDGADSKFVTDLEQLEKVGELGRDDKWRFDVQYMGLIPEKTVQNGDLLATNCIFDSTDRKTATTGGYGSRDEMCIQFIYYYPAGGIESRLYQSGPRYFGTSVPKDATSIIDIAKQDAAGTEVPLWRQAYLSGDLSCNTTGFSTLELTDFEKSWSFWFQAYAVCDGPDFEALLEGDEQKWPCPQECAWALYNGLGCALLADAVDGKGSALSLFSSPYEAAIEANCRQAFEEFYEKQKPSSNQKKGRKG